MIVIGLTGGIGSGKSAVADLLAERGAVIVDSDLIAHRVVAPDGPAHRAVVERFGPGVVDPDGGIDRPALARLVFADPAARADLQAIVHPEVTSALAARIAEEAGTDHVVVAVIPLLVEVNWTGGDAVVVVDCPEELAVRRLVEQRGMDEADVRRRMAAQATRAERLARADHVIVNDGTLEELRAQVSSLPFW